MILVTGYTEKYHSDFKRLNLEWLGKYGLAEARDLEVLDDPGGTILAHGGAIFLAMDGEKVVGTAGLMKENESGYELAKMSVAETHQGRGISKLLLDRCLEEVKRQGGHTVILYSSSKLKAALGLYEKYGFRYVELVNSPFVTADIKMELVF